MTTKVLADAFAIAINASAGSDPASLPAFVPAGREFAIAMAGASVQNMIDAARSQNGFADSDLPKRMREDDKDVDLTDLIIIVVAAIIASIAGSIGESLLVHGVTGAVSGILGSTRSCSLWGAWRADIRGPSRMMTSTYFTEALKHRP